MADASFRETAAGWPAMAGPRLGGFQLAAAGVAWKLGQAMKSNALLCVCAAAIVAGSVAAHAQYRSPRQYMRRITPPQPAPPAPPAPPAVKAPAAAKVAPALPPGPVFVPIPQTPTPLTPEQQARAEAEKSAALQRTIEFQKKRAEAGSATAQYDLGIRYLKGDGLAADPAEARKWLEAAARQDHAWAKRKLTELDKESASSEPPIVSPAPAPEATDAPVEKPAAPTPGF